MTALADHATMRLLVQADHDGELDAAQAASVAAHLESCDDCTRLQAELASLSHSLRDGNLRFPAPESLPRRLGLDPPAVERPWRASRVPALAGLALAASLALLLWPGRPIDEMASGAVAAHIRALQPGHLLDVPSSDQHTVRPWFDGKLDFAPPVPDFAAQGFPLVGGRLDYLGGRPVAALVYRHGQHVIDVFVSPIARPGAGPGAEPNADQGITSSTSATGYQVRRWARSGMQFQAVSDLNPAELATFTTLWRDALARP